MPSLDPMLTYVLAGLSMVSLLWHLSLHASARLKWRARRRSRTDFTPPITVLKPLCGVDEGLYENLVSFARQDYPDFELVFGVEDPRDAALRVVWRLRREYPDVQMRLVVGTGPEAAANPKVRNLLHMLRVAQHDHLLISDSNVMARPDYLRTTVQEMADPAVGLVSNPVVGVGEQSLGAALENFHLNTLVVGSVCLSDSARQPCVIGKSMLMRRCQLEAIGGLRAMRDILAEDFVLGRMYQKAGHRVVLSELPVHTRNIRMPVERFLARHLRWAQLRRHVSAPLFFSEALAYLTPWLGLLALCSLEHTLRAWVWIGALAALLVRLASDVLLARHVAGEWPALRAVLLSPLKDCAMLALWCVALFKRSVWWRGHPMRIGAGSRVSMAGHEIRLRALTFPGSSSPHGCP